MSASSHKETLFVFRYSSFAKAKHDYIQIQAA